MVLVPFSLRDLAFAAHLRFRWAPHDPALGNGNGPPALPGNVMLAGAQPIDAGCSQPGPDRRSRDASYKRALLKRGQLAAPVQDDDVIPQW